MDIINKDGYGREAYFSRDKLEIIKDISENSEAINRKCSIEHADLIDRNICEYIKLVVQFHLDAGLKACVVMIDRMKQKKKDAVVTQLQHLNLRINTRVLISFEDGVLDLLYQAKTLDKLSINDLKESEILLNSNRPWIDPRQDYIN